MKKNCWEVKKCGREPGGVNVKELGVCPAATEDRLDGVHEGKNAGRACWVVAGTFCKGEVQGFFARKYKDCEKCDFYQMVRKEEGAKFTFSYVLLNMIGWKEKGS
ncbi:MAG: hypothetical protein HZA11_07120 [Nitrospirae bacterium]|nr:hypothetical protein [Nitrospirota bacterium]